MIRQLVVIAGGKGTRMGKESELAKSLQLINGKSILERQCRFFYEKGFQNFLILLGHKSEEIILHIKEINSKLGIEIKYTIEEFPLGTGGSLINSYELLEESFVLILGDIMINTDIRLLTEQLDNQKVDLALFYHPSSHPEDSDLLKLDSSQTVTAILTKPRKEGLFRNHGNAGCYAMKRNILLDLLSEFEAGKKVDLDRELIPRLIEKGFTTKAVRNVGFIRDCGTPERLKFVNDNWNEIENKQIVRPAIFIDRDGTINKLNGFITNLNQIEVFDDAASFVAQMNKINYWVIVVTNQPVIARGEVSTEMLDSFHAEIERIVIEGGGIIDDFFYCPHHPDSGFQGEILNLKINCGCRKPEIGMILEACKRYPIDLRNSWMIGDTWRDAELAKRAGIKFIKINPNESETEENQSVKSLSDAANLILMSAGNI